MFVLSLLIAAQRNAPCVKQNSIEYNFLFNAFRLSLGKTSRLQSTRENSSYFNPTSVSPKAGLFIFERNYLASYQLYFWAPDI